METTTSTATAPAEKTTKSDYVPMDQYIAQAKIALTNASLPDIAPLLARRSYPGATIATKLDDLTALEKLIQAQKKEYGEQYEATEAYNRAIKELFADYAEHLKLARMVLGSDTAAKTTLGMRGKRKRSQSSLTAQALLFYTGVMENVDYLAALATKGVYGLELQTAKDGWGNLDTLAATQTKETGEAQKATADRDAAYDTFGDWMDEFYETAEIALRKTPQLMEKLGMVQG